LAIFHTESMAAGPQPTKKERQAQARAEREEAERRTAAGARRNRRLWQLGGLVALAAIVVVVAIIVSSGGSKSTATPKKQAGETVPGQSLAAEEFDGIPQSGATLGNPKAPYTIVEYGDLVCPACKAYSDQIIPTVVQNFVRTGKVKMEFRPFAFVRPWSKPAAQYGWAAAQQDKMWNFAKLWYLNQGDESTNYVNDAFARKIASGVPGLDADKLIAASKGAQAKADTAATAQQFNAHGFNATPSFTAGATGHAQQPFDMGQSASEANTNVGKLVAGGT
jgi:protein-disulfide isomerase